MLKPRLIPVLLLKNGILVRSKTFNLHQSTGDPVGQVERYAVWKADELIYLNINREGKHDYRETMQVIGSTTSKKDIDATLAGSFSEVIRQVAKHCTIPLTAGGGLRSLEDIRDLLEAGADKVSVNTAAIENPEFIEHAAQKFGNQCIVVSIDSKYDGNKHEVYSHYGKKSTGIDPIIWAKEVEKRGAGEILLQSIDRDGTGKGYDNALIQMVVNAVSIPVIALGGAGSFDDFISGLKDAHASAVAAANIFHFTEHSVLNAKKHIQNSGIDIRI